LRDVGFLGMGRGMVFADVALVVVYYSCLRPLLWDGRMSVILENGALIVPLELG
jgi:hypothetical protein